MLDLTGGDWDVSTEPAKRKRGDLKSQEWPHAMSDESINRGPMRESTEKMWIRSRIGKISKNSPLDKGFQESLYKDSCKAAIEVRVFEEIEQADNQIKKMISLLAKHLNINNIKECAWKMAILIARLLQSSTILKDTLFMKAGVRVPVPSETQGFQTNDSLITKRTTGTQTDLPEHLGSYATKVKKNKITAITE